MAGGVIPDVIALFRRDFESRIRAKQALICGSKAGDYETYLAHFYELRGLELALSSFNESVKKAEADDDDF